MVNNNQVLSTRQNHLSELISVELIIMCGGYFISSALIGSQRYVVYPLLVLSIIVNFFCARRVQNTMLKRDEMAAFLFALVLLLSCSVSIISQLRTGLEETIAQLVLIVLGVVYSLQIMRWFRFSYILLVGYIGIVVSLFVYALSVPQESIRGTLFSNVSSNAVSAELLWLSGLLSLSMLKQGSTPLPTVIKYLPLIMTSALCIFVGGRSGMIIALMQLIGMFLSLNKPKELSLSLSICSLIWLFIRTSS